MLKLTVEQKFNIRFLKFRIDNILIKNNEVKNIRMSVSEIASAKRTLVRLFQPLFHATPVENVKAWKFFYNLLLLEALNTNGTGSGTLLHNHCLDGFLFELNRELLSVHTIIEGNYIGRHIKFNLFY